MSFNCILALATQMVGSGFLAGAFSSELYILQTVIHLWIMHPSVADADSLDEEVEVALRGFQNAQQRFLSLLFWGDCAERR